jgi:hypothetical protein
LSLKTAEAGRPEYHCTAMASSTEDRDGTRIIPKLINVPTKTFRRKAVLIGKTLFPEI